MRNVFVVIMVALCFGACSSSGGKKDNSQSCETLMETYHRFYPDAQYITAVGEGDTLTAAQNRAMGVISSIFEAKIKSDATATEAETTRTKNGKTVQSDQMSSVSEQVNVASDQSLINIKFGKQCTDSVGRVKVVAYIDRAETAELYKEKIEENDQIVRIKAQGFASATDPLHKYAYLKAALFAAEKNQVLLTQLSVIDPEEKKALDLGYDFTQLADACRKQAKRLVFSVRVAGDSSGKIPGYFETALTGQGFVVEESGNLSLTASVRIEKVDLNNKYINYRWTLGWQVLDSAGNTVISQEVSERASGISETNAESQAYRDIEKKIKNGFILALDSYFKTLTQ